MHCFLSAYMENGSLGSLQMDTCTGGGDMFGSISINLKKIFNFTIEKHKQDCNMNAFYLKGAMSAGEHAL